MSVYDAKSTAEALWRTWIEGGVIVQLPPSRRPVTMEQAQAAQLHFPEVANSPICGWKIAATSEGGQNHIGVSGPLEGPYLACKTHDTGVSLSMNGNRMAVAEAEFAFVLGSDIAARQHPYSWDEIADSVQSLRPSLELPDSRFSDFKAVGEINLLADCACARDCVLGEPTDLNWMNIDLNDSPVQLLIDGKVVTQGSGADALGDPRTALVWLVNRLSARGVSLLSGQFITTGVCGKPMPIVPNSHVVADLGRFGTAEAYLTD